MLAVVLAAASLAVVALGLLSTLAAAQVVPDAEEQIADYRVTLTVGTDGSLDVVEEIAYDFGSAERHGIIRTIPVRFHYDDRFDRVYDLQIVEISSETAPDQYETTEDGGVLRIRVGDPDLTVAGLHEYVIRYRVAGALNGFAEHDELYWNAVGHEWVVPIAQASVTTRMPAAIEDALCFAGPFGASSPCDTMAVRARTVTTTHTGLLPGEGVTVVASIPTGVVLPPEPLLVERWSLQRAFSLTPATLGVTGILSALVVALIARTLWVVGRDRRHAGSAVDARFGAVGGESAVERVPLFEGGPFPVEYSPPGDLRPGLIGTLRDEVAHPLDITATIVDLATRGYLRIEEVEGDGRGAADWRLTRVDPPPHDDLQPYEQLLLASLFEDGPSVEVASLRRKFRARLEAVQGALYEELVRRRWYRRSPRSTRTRWLAAGLVGLVASVALLVAAAAFTEWAIVPIPLIVGSVAIIAGHNLTPARTARGTATLRQVRGFERFIASAELYRSQFAERARIFYDYLPYAIVFGLTEEWARAFEGLDTLPPADWYSGRGAIAVGVLAEDLTRFTQESAGAIAAVPASSGSSGFGGGGFSGGGGGGGGGGSW